MLTGFHIGLHLKFDSLSRSENVSRDVGIFYHTFTHLCGAYKVNSNDKYNTIIIMISTIISKILMINSIKMS